MAATLGIDQDAVVGKLIRVWIWADQQSRDGHALSVTKAFLDRVTFQPGFADSMESAGWLTNDGNLSLPNFDRHNGETAKKRALSNRRKALSRNGHADVPEMSRSERDQNRDQRREEKRREENTTTTEPPQSQQASRRPRTQAKPKDLRECLAVADRIGLSAGEATAWYNDQDAAGWRDRHGMVYGNWIKVMTTHRDILRDKRARFGSDKISTPGTVDKAMAKARKELDRL